MSLSGSANSESLSGAMRHGLLATLAAWLAALVRRFPVLMLFLVVVVSNVAGSVFNFLYNDNLIVQRYMNPRQVQVFWDIVAPLYNVLAYPLCLALVLYMMLPLYRSERLRRRGQPIPENLLEATRHLLVNAPYYAVWISVLGWMPGAVFFPALICLVGGTNHALELWFNFTISFTVSAGLTIVQTFFLLEGFCIYFLYPHYFGTVRPAQVEGAERWRFGMRLFMLWCAVGFMPLVALLMVVIQVEQIHLRNLAIGVFLAVTLTGGGIVLVVGHGLLRWLSAHTRATEQVARRNFQVRIREQRPDEWGRLTDRFNDMTEQLARAEEVRDMFGQIVHPDDRDVVLALYKERLGGEVRDITVLFADIRGFTSRSAGQPPELVVTLLNRFLTLAVGAIEDLGGRGTKFLGDGLMTLFNASAPRANHADLAVLAAQELLWRLEKLNRDLEGHGEAPLRVGVGIHSGPALVGCVGATIPLPGGKTTWRREFTAIGETVNLGQRLEQLTKTCGGPILISEQTRTSLKREVLLTPLGPQTIPGFGHTLTVYRVEAMRQSDSEIQRARSQA